MPTRIIRPTAEDTTRERILKAAMLRFSTYSYEETGLRDIATDVGEPGDLHLSLVDEVLSEKGTNEIRPFDIIVRSFSSPEASRVLREFLNEGFVKPFASKSPLISEQRASVIAAFLAGVGILRDVVGAPALQRSGNDHELGLLISEVIALLMNDDKECQTTSASMPVRQESK